MMRALNEIGGMVLKAGRGAGVPLGHCEDLSRAAIYLAATDAAAFDCVPRSLVGPFPAADVLITGDTAVVQNARAVMAGPVAVDCLRAGLATVRLEQIDEPMVIFALCAAMGVGVTHRFDAGDLILAPDATTPAPAPVGPVTIAQAAWDVLNDLAARTYVPATEASRLAGAGAGLTDND